MNDLSLCFSIATRQRMKQIKSLQRDYAEGLRADVLFIVKNNL